MAHFRCIVAALVLAGLVMACDRDPYMARKGGYTPGEPYPSRSTGYASQADYYRKYRGIHPTPQM